MMPTLLSLAVPGVVIKATSGAASDDKVGIMTSLRFQWSLKLPSFASNASYASK